MHPSLHCAGIECIEIKDSCILIECVFPEQHGMIDEIYHTQEVIMTDHRWKKLLAFGAILITVAGFACAAGGDDAAVAEGPVELPFLMRNAGNDSATLINQFYVDGFNAEFEGKYKIVVEWMPDGLSQSGVARGDIFILQYNRKIPIPSI